MGFSFQKLSKIRIKPLIGSGVLLYFGSQIMGKTLREWQTWDTLQKNAIATQAEITNTRTAINQSGKVRHYKLTYEFLAQGDGGSKVSPSALSQKLQDKFVAGSEIKLPLSEVPKERTDNQSYFSHTQIISPTDYRKLSGNELVPIIYAKNNPQNAAIQGIGGYPVLEAGMVALLLALSLGLGYFGIAPTFKSKSTQLFAPNHQQFQS